ncbi:methylmalonyl-CoA mutase [Marinicauda salina]|uniref:Methylmalonyl-CoA mutase n=1 Tax=Marinicauda salina TaxID=2135793 RepID=A0A2U2BTW8_9PROT|nr:methylmalonyl-CoA mutase family protein [Marinicauda salina]PWE17430.1 methylmalonyl-CoA mutase [Marinicauda salina]
MTEAIRPMAEGFPPADDAEWRALADEALKGADFDRLVRRTVDGIARGPLFARGDLADVEAAGAPGAAPFVRGLAAERDAHLPWGIRQAVDDPDPADANAAILDELHGGASEIELRLDPAGEDGVAVRTLDELKRTLDGVLLDLAPVHLAPARLNPQYGAMLLALFEDAGLDGTNLHGGLGLSPIGRKSRLGGGAEKLPDRLKRTAEAAAYCAETFPRLGVVDITAGAPHEAGGSEAQEIAFCAAGGASYMRVFLDHGLSPDQAANALVFSLSADADIHLTIAKLRAARRVWARVTESFGCSPAARGMRVHVHTSARMMTARDPWTNLIRVSCAALGAAAGGADSITVRPLTHARPGRPTSFARRLARNLQILLAEESHIGKVADPAGGGYLHETLGARLAEAGWGVFQEIERRGGLFETVKAGWLQAEIAKVRAQRETAYAEGRESLIGLSQYPVLGAEPIETLPRDYAPPALDAPELEPQPFAGKIAAARSGAQIRPLSTPEPEWEPVAFMRFAEPFEALRDAADAFAEKTGARPRAFLATLGGLADFNARATFAENRLAAGGVEATGAEARESVEATVKAFADSGAQLAVICGTDAAYEADAADLAKALRAAGADAVWVAGKPADIAGVDHYIHMRSNALDDLARAHAATGVKA